VLAAFLRGLEPHADVEELFRRHSGQLGAPVKSGGVARGVSASQSSHFGSSQNLSFDKSFSLPISRPGSLERLTCSAMSRF